MVLTMGPSIRTIGLYFYNARWYDPVLGRFLQPDPLVPEPGNPQALNRYSYSLNNPVRFVDPSGHDPLDATWQQEFRA
ncbi:MAG: RHS repeat-associated core domain-containing protein, partial [Candidatus Caldarchaeum sp.]